ncbi:hypothetical protein MHU86_3729 [Fragilaria crotonensis]|nr:hypothetical protein MHU86_22523 [Fragilaria crotonensis]KAI2510618.1 hypothetical protein MHU86_3729 [Fragilaria crotonensis]
MCKSSTKQKLNTKSSTEAKLVGVKDRISSGDISVRHCPTLPMLADSFTKALQGNLFRKFRDVILGINHIDALSSKPCSQLEDRIEIRPAKRGTDSASIATDDSTKRGDSEMKKADATTTVSWADNVKRTPATEQSNIVARAKNRQINKLVAIGHSIATIPN